MNALSTALSRLARPFTGFSPRPAHDWHVLLGLSTGILVALVAWHLLVFRSVVLGGSAGAVRQAASAPSAPSALDSLPAFLDARAAADEAYIGGSYSFADPSQ